MKIYRFKNGDACPCCGQALTGKTLDELLEFSIQVYGIASALGLPDWIIRPGEDAISLTPEELAQTMTGG